MGYALFEDAELNNGNPPEDAVLSRGVVRNFAFHPKRLAEKREEIAGLVREIVPDEFLPGKGGGHSFLALCMDREGRQWGEHQHMEVLVCLAQAVGLARYCLPKELWSSLPGGVPYITFNPEGVST